MPKLGFERFESVLYQTTSLLLWDGDIAVAVDPCVTAQEVSRIAERAHEVGVRITDLLVTHADWDHVCGVAAFSEAAATMGAETASRIRSDETSARLTRAAAEFRLAPFGAPRADRVLAAGLAHRVGPFVVETLALRGHTSDSLGYRIRTLDLLIVGDYLSAAEFPFVSSTAEYRMTLAGLADLLRRDPPGLVVPGHGPPLTAAAALAIAEDDLAYLRALHAAVAAALVDGSDAHVAGLAVVVPREAPDELRAGHATNVDMQIEELVCDQG